MATAFCLAGASPSLAATSFPSEFSEQLFAMELGRHMATNCRRLDRSQVAASSLQSALRNYRSVVADTKLAGGAARLAEARQRWKSSRDEVDTSCIVGPQETPNTAYASLIAEFGRATGAVKQMLTAQVRSK